MVAKKLQPGDDAPDFELYDQNRKLFRLSDLRGKKPVVLMFYPKDDTLICTEETCLFRDSYEYFKNADVEIVGISDDPQEIHRDFSLKHSLPYRLLSDSEGSVRKLYGVRPRLLGLLKGRETFVVGKDGKIISHCAALVNAQKHVEMARKALVK